MGRKTCLGCKVELQAPADYCILCYSQIHKPCPACMACWADGTWHVRRGERKGTKLDCSFCNNERWVLMPHLLEERTSP
jgi:hypothetical protein